jgi:uncharacterized protein
MRVARVVAIYDGGQGGAMPIMAEEARDAAYAPPPVVVQTSAPVVRGTNSAVITARVDFALAE